MGSVYFVCSRIFFEWLGEINSSGNPSSKYARRKVGRFWFAVLSEQYQCLSLRRCASVSVEISSLDYRLVFGMGEVCIQGREGEQGI